ncbi:MAG: hypothetical protein AAFO89_10300 [Planctomycetota bacterium]
MLDAAARDKYPELNPNEVKTLVIQAKWMATREQAVAAEVDRVTSTLVTWATEIAARYEQTLPEVKSEVDEVEG